MNKTKRLFTFMLIPVMTMFTVACGATGGSQATQSNATSSGTTSKLTLQNAVVGFSQSQSEINPFRAVETQSIKSEAQKLGVKKLFVTNAQGDVSKQVSDVEDMIAQGVNILIITPESFNGLTPALNAAKSHHIPVFLIDSMSSGKAGVDYVTFLGSDFYKQAQRAADGLVQATGGNANIAVLTGPSGDFVTTQRTNGFTDYMKKHPGMKIVATQPANFIQSKAQDVMQQMLLANPNINAVYAENDTMALGAISAIQAAGKTPGKDVKIVSIDGIKQVVKDVVSGQVYADVETNPRFGPLVFDAIKKYLAGESLPAQIVSDDQLYTKANAQKALDDGQAY
ncbi:ABC transporter substrate-binding protein [Fodinisporobacter ferrooxydans]|uniref:ABC transporter substrate-binding protein n=1 Tax=Fodinisporobacter ferrooxydans TaxID=2901836 RepID=A0ABY4CKZ5_9BACL|nr:ABC transporter substrate-binding protein [Alicyclobacillaceae bacterium MYW30-H2]